jgi:hypothetical protein
VTDVTYARLRATDPGHWRATALAWRAWAALAGRWAAEFGPHVAKLKNAWSGAAATAAAARLAALRRGLNLFRLLCWEADQALSEFAAALARAKTLLAQAAATVGRAGAAQAKAGPSTVTGAVERTGGAPAATAERDGGTYVTGAEPTGGAQAATTGRTGGARAATTAGTGDAQASTAGRTGGAWVAAARRDGGADAAVAQEAAAEQAGDDAQAAALAVAAAADATASGRLAEVAAAASTSAVPPPPASPLPPCTATPAEVNRWWDTLTPAQRRWLVATEPGWLGPLDGVPAGFRDLANRLLLEDRRAELDQALATASGHEWRRLRDLRHGLDALADRLADGDGPRAYLMRLDLAEEGRAIVALGDPDRADDVLTHVPGMTADLASYRGELVRAERVAVRAAELGPAGATSAVLWLDYDAPDFVDEAAGAGRAETGAAGLRRFQEGLRATHLGGAAHQTVLGHSYGSMVVGSAARSPGLEADSVVFVGSPGVGVDSATQLRVPAGQVWSTTSRSDVIQYMAVAPESVLRDLAFAQAVPIAGPVMAFGRPEHDLWFGRNPSDPAFGAHVFASQADGGHLGYWDVGSTALDGITTITLGRAR